MAYNGFKGVGPRKLGCSPLKQLKRSKDTIYVGKKYKPGDYVEETELEDSIMSQTKDFPQLSVQDYSTVKKKKGKNYVVKDN